VRYRDGIGEILAPSWPRSEVVLAGQEAVSIAQAAKILGITEDAVRKRVRRGEIKAKKVDNKWQLLLDGIETGKTDQEGTPRTTKNGLENGIDTLIWQLQGEVVFLRSQLSIKDQQLAAKDQQITERDRDIETWREQVRYKDLLIARLEDRLIQLPPPEPDEQKPELSQPGESGNVLQRFWHWLGGGE
jgi:hypothetical protein